MATVLVVYGSRHGGTQGIAERIGTVLRGEGLDASVTAADGVRDVGTADAIVIGSGVYMGSWLKEPLAFLDRNRAALAARPVWLFSSGPIPNPEGKSSGDPIEDALGPADGPGSGGRKKVEALAAAIHPRGHRVFNGAYDPDDPPRTLAERVVRMMPAAKNVLPAGDFRDWEAIEAWAREIAAAVRTTPVTA